jgi:tetratricopeptide (TPR) repeat protein
LRRSYWPFGFALVALSLLFPWFDPVTTPRFNGLNFPFAHSAYLWPGHFVFFSYGTAAIVVAGLGFAAWWIKKGLAVFCAGMLLLLGGMTFFLQITSWEPTWLKMALEGGEDFQHCYHLEVAYSIPNIVVRSPARGLFEPVEALTERFSAGVASLGSGWVCFCAGAIWICAAGLYQMNDWGRLKLVLPAFAVLVAVLGALQLWRPIAAERLLASAEMKETRGAFADAATDVRRAMAVDEWQRLQPACFVHLGTLYQKMQSPDRPEILFARAVLYQSRGLTQEALFYYGQAADGGNPQVRRVALLEKARLAARYAATLYKQGGIGDACRYWLLSIEAAPDKLNGFFGAGRAFHDMADYSAAIKYFEPVFYKTSQPCLLADIENDLGDCWYRLGHPDVARKYYMASRKMHDRKDFRALKTLTESYYR